MSLPLHLQSIKSSGVYRFVFDKSILNNQNAAETLRLLVGYSDKGPFNTPVYITSRDEFIRTYGNISKRLEKKGIYFHRLALQALAGGPILCLNLKNFDSAETLEWAKFTPKTDLYNLAKEDTNRQVTTVYDTNRFWTVKAEDQVDLATTNTKYIVITTTDTADAACSLIIRKAVPEQYALTIREYYEGIGEELPDYLVNIQDTLLNDYFADVYVFRGEFTKALCLPGAPLGKYFNVSGSTGSEVITLEENYTDAFGEPADALAALAQDPASNFIAAYQGTTIPFFKNANGSYISLDILFNSDYSEHKMLMNMNEEILTSSNAGDILPVKALGTTTTDTKTYYERKDGTTAGTYYYSSLGENPSTSIKKKAVEYTGTSNIPTTDQTATTTDYGEYVYVVAVAGDNIKPLYLKGFSYNKEVSAENSLNVITGDYGKGLQEALTNRIDVEYHYLVDTFDTAITNDKSTLSALAQKKDNCFAILNFPKIKKYIDAGTYNTNRTLDFNKVKASFIMPDAASGDSWCGFFTQVVVTDGTVRTTIPSAGLVSNLFMDKWTSRQPYYIVAGSQYGRLQDGTLVGPDYAFSKTDRDVLEPYGINVIVYEPRRGTYINSEQTGKQIPVSALSKIHIRELVIYLQDEIAELLESYRWELNTQTLRDKIKARADVILSTVQNNSGLYDFLNVCDESNNTAEAIDNEFLVLDTHIEPARGAGKMVEQLYIYRTGEMRSTLIQG